ncbi:MAG: hypothetical protein ABSA43_02520 [Candidatus Microgenomates bacterium]|jgi:hypothetical protein
MTGERLRTIKLRPGEILVVKQPEPAVRVFQMKENNGGMVFFPADVLESLEMAVIHDMAEKWPRMAAVSSSDDAQKGQMMEPKDAAKRLKKIGSIEAISQIILTRNSSPDLRENSQFKQDLQQAIGAYWPKD